jgi:hypothetical protein
MALICPGCHEVVVKKTPRDLTPVQEWAGVNLRYSHAVDRTQLCPVIGPDGYEPADPVRE